MAPAPSPDERPAPLPEMILQGLNLLARDFNREADMNRRSAKVLEDAAAALTDALEENKRLQRRVNQLERAAAQQAAAPHA